MTKVQSKAAISTLIGVILITLSTLPLFCDDRDENIDVFIVLDKSLSMVEEIGSVRDYVQDTLVDEIIIVVAAAFTLKRVAMNENRGRHLKLVGGVVMIMLAGVMVVSPELMESLMSVVGIFAGSAVIVVIVIAIDRSVRRRNVLVRESDKRSDR